MKFITNLDEKEYEAFLKTNPQKHFLQSFYWGKHQKNIFNKDYVLVGVKKDDKLISGAMLLKTKLYFNYSYFYAPKGLIVDYHDDEVLYFFIKNLKDFLKKEKAIFLTIDPDIIIRKNNEKIKENFKIIEKLKELNFKHTGFVQNFENRQPRFTFEIDLEKDYEKNFSRNVKRAIKKGEKTSITEIGDKNDLNKFIKLMEITENKKEFIAQDLNYYKSVYELFNEENIFRLYLGYINPIEIKKDLDNKLKELENELKSLIIKAKDSTINEKKNQIKGLKKELLEYENINESKIYLNAYLIMYYGDKGWFLYGGNNTKFLSTNSTYKTYLDILRDAKNLNIKTMDQFGTTGPDSDDENLKGIHNFKKGFGGDYLEFIGEFNLIIEPFLYKLFNIFVPLRRKIIRTIRKIKLRK